MTPLQWQHVHQLAHEADVAIAAGDRFAVRRFRIALEKLGRTPRLQLVPPIGGAP